MIARMVVEELRAISATKLEQFADVMLSGKAFDAMVQALEHEDNDQAQHIAQLPKVW